MVIANSRPTQLDMGFLGSMIVAAIAVTTVGASSYCPAPHVPYNGGYYSPTGYHSFYVGDVIYYGCDDGYQMHGYSTNDCYYDSERYGSFWRYEPPLCKSKHYVLRVAVYMVHTSWPRHVVYPRRAEIAQVLHGHSTYYRISL